MARSKRRKDFIESTTAHLLQIMQHALEDETSARRAGLLQSLDPRVKVIGLPALLVAAALSHSFAVIGALFGCAVALALLSGVSLKTLALREWIGVGIFTGAVAFPALFITPGEVVYRLPILDWAITLQGLRSAAYLLARVETCATLGLLLVLCTPWAHVLKALRVLRVPVVMVVILGMTHRYVFLSLQTAQEMWEARRALRRSTRRRAAASPSRRDRRRFAR